MPFPTVTHTHFDCIKYCVIATLWPGTLFLSNSVVFCSWGNAAFQNETVLQIFLFPSLFLSLLERRYTHERRAAGRLIRLAHRCGYAGWHISWTLIKNVVSVIIAVDAAFYGGCWIYYLPNIVLIFVWDGQISSWLALPPCLHLYPPPPLPRALAVWHATGFRSEWLRLSRLGPAPARSYRMCMLDVFSAGQGWCSQGKIQQTHSFTTSQNITSTLPSHQQPSQSLYLTKLNMYTTTVRPSQRELTRDKLQPHFCAMTDFLRPVLSLSVSCGLLSIGLSHPWTCSWWQQCSREELTSLTPACCFTLLGLPGHASANIQAPSYYWSQRCSDRKLHEAVCPALPWVTQAACLVLIAVSAVCLCYSLKYHVC